MSEPARHLDWNHFEALIHGGVPAVEVVKGSPKVEIYISTKGERIGLRTPTSEDAPANRLSEVHIDTRVFDGAAILEVSTENRNLYKDFYSLACSIADRIQVGMMKPNEAVLSALDAWESLLHQDAVLADESQIGLAGELWMLQRLKLAFGWSFAIEAWKGPISGEHDFSWGEHDVEVKTTTSESRSHVISSLTQLESSQGRALQVLSIQLTPAGPRAGSTLSETIEGISHDMKHADPSALVKFQSLLESVGWRLRDSAHYDKRRMLRTKPALVPVDEHFPRLTNAELADIDQDKLARMSDFHYRVDVTGMGFEDGTTEFLDVLPLEGEL